MKFPYTKKILNKEDCSALKKIILRKEGFVKSLGPDVYPGTGYNSLTGRHTVFNWLNDLEFRDIFLPKLKKFFIELDHPFPIILKCWANTFRVREGILPHHHGSNVLSGNVFICGDPNIGTNFLEEEKEILTTEQSISLLSSPSKNIQSKEGNITIFPGSMPHYVLSNSLQSFNEYGIRISIALDIFLNGLIPENTNEYYQISL